MNLSLPEPDCRWISVGKEFDSYTDMCRTLRVEPGRGSSLAAQKKLFGRYFAYRKTEGRKCVITEIYNNPLPDGYALYELDGGGKGKYVKCVEPLLRLIVGKRIAKESSVDTADDSNIETFDNSSVDRVVDNDGSGSINITSNAVGGVSENPRGNAVCIGFSGKSCYFTKSDLLLRLGFINDNFFRKEPVLRRRKDVVLSRWSKVHPDVLIVKVNGVDEISEIGNRLVITTDDLNYFENMSALVYEKWRSAEKAINKHGVIFCKSVFTLPCDGGITETDALQNAFIKQAECNALADMGIESVQRAFAEHLYKLFCLKRNAELGKIMNTPDITVSESVKITLNDSIADRVTDNSDNIDNNTEDELRLMINQMIIDDFHKRIRSCKKQYDEKRIKNGNNNDDDGIWDNIDNNRDVDDNKSTDNRNNLSNVRNVGLDSPDNVKNNTVIDMENVKGSAVDDNTTSVSADSNSNNPNLRDRVLSQPDFCKKMDKLVDIFIKL